jgi:hypothetical protein
MVLVERLKRSPLWQILVAFLQLVPLRMKALPYASLGMTNNPITAETLQEIVLVKMVALDG